MKRSFLLASAVGALLALGLVVSLGRLADLAGPSLTWDVGRRHPGTVPAELAAALRASDERLDITLFVSPAARMPSHLQDVEPAVRALLHGMADIAGQRLTWRVIDPDLSGEAGAHYAASRRVSPVRVRRVVDDAESQAEIWSSLVIARQGRPRRDDILVQGIENAHLPHLGALLAAHLRTADPTPTFALAAPPGFGELPRYLSQSGPVIEIDVDATGRIPADIDVLFWLEPGTVSPRHVLALRRFLDGGGTAVIAGSPWRMRYARDHGETRFHAEPTGSAWRELLEPFGLRPLPDLVVDRNVDAVPVPVNGALAEVSAPFHLRNLPAFRDFRPLRTPARGALSFVAPGPLAIDPRRVADAGFEAHVAATTTEWARVLRMPEGSFTLADLDSTLVAPKQNLMVLLSSTDPWAGQLLVLASSSPFRDGIVGQPGYGHAVFLRDVARSFADAEQVVRRRVDRREPAALPPLNDGARLVWRLLVVGLVPLLLLALAGWRLVGAPGQWHGVARPASGWAVPAGVAVAVLGLAAALRSPLSALQLDATADARHTPDAGVVQQLRARPGLTAELVLSPASQLPAVVRDAARRAESLLRTGDVDLVVRRQEVDGTLPSFEIDRVRRDTTVTARVVSALRLSQAGRQTWIPRIDGATAPHLDFLVAGALARLDSGGAPVVAVVADLPRLSPAEALEDYQKKGLSAPRGVDVYSRAKDLLRDYGYAVHHVSPRDPVFPPHADAILWFQPRRDSTPVLTRVSRHLADGGRAIVAMQHFNIQQRQYRGTGFETVHWPQPQFQDFDRYLRFVGVEQVREVLFDRAMHHLDLDTQVNRTAVREYDAQRVALPFLLRAVGPQLAETSPITSRLGDLLFIWGNRFAFDAATLAAVGMRAEVLVTTTTGAWSYDWRGGWLPVEVFDGDARAGLGSPQALALTLQGRFPAIDALPAEGGGVELRPVRRQDGPPGWLLLIGSSEMFKDPQIGHDGFAHEQFLLNAVARAVHGADMARLQARHGGAARGFVDPGSAARTLWRVVILGSGPALLGLFALWRFRRVSSA